MKVKQKRFAEVSNKRKNLLGTVCPARKQTIFTEPT